MFDVLNKLLATLPAWLRYSSRACWLMMLILFIIHLSSIDGAKIIYWDQ